MMFTNAVIKSSVIVKEVTFGALGGGLSAAIASAVTRSPPEKGSTLVEFHQYSKRSQRIDHQPILLMARRWADRLNALRPQLHPPHRSTRRAGPGNSFSDHIFVGTLVRHTTYHRLGFGYN